MTISREVEQARHKYNDCLNAQTKVRNAVDHAELELRALQRELSDSQKQLGAAEASHQLDGAGIPQKLRKTFLDTTGNIAICEARIAGLQDRWSKAQADTAQSRAELERAFTDWSKSVTTQFEQEYLVALDSFLAVADDFTAVCYSLPGNNGAIARLRQLAVYDPRGKRDLTISRSHHDSWRNEQSQRLFDDLIAVRAQVIPDAAPESTTVLESIEQEPTVFDVAGRPLKLVS